MEEQPFADVHTLVGELVPALMPYLDRPFVLFGHSMGALVAFETARLIEREGSLTPARLIVSARVAPQCTLARPPINALPQAEFVEILRQLNGTPADILRDANLMTLIGPALRADLAIHENYVYQTGLRLSCDILAFGGLRDVEAERAGLNAWAGMTTGSFRLRMLPGGHFFIQSAQDLFLRILTTELYPLTRYVARGNSLVRAGSGGWNGLGPAH
jgi:medium-chain acyl-[acyl-carrier-protein] hydrolase